MALSSDLQEAIREFAAAGPAELRDNGARVAPLSSLSWEIRGNGEKPLLHLWSENHNLTRRVLAITDHSEQRLALAVECFGRTKPDRLEFLRMEFDRPQVDLDREAFVQRIKDVCQREFPDDSLESITSVSDLEHSLSGSYVRGVLRRGRERWALIAPTETPAALDAARCLTFALLWLERLQDTADRKNISGVRILLPKASAAHVVHLLPVLRPDVRVQLFERDDVLETLRNVQPSELANFSSWIVPIHESQALLQRARQELGAFLPVGPEAFSFHPNVSAGQVVVRFRGLSFLRWHASESFFGVRDMKTKLEPGKETKLRELVRQLATYRHPLASDTRHPLFRMQPERWLESLVREDVARIDAAFDSRFAYSQVLATTASEHGILDLLTVTHTGRLAILELKADEDPVFLLQAAKYWLRIKRHLEQQDFPRFGYFPGIALQSASPLIYLIAPALRFHPSTGALLRHLHPRIEVIRVGLAESWRRGLCVVLRQ